MSANRGLTIKQYQPVVQPASVTAPVVLTMAASVAPPLPVVHNIRDDYERWYAEPTHSNRMVLSLRSGIQEEISWALDRLLRLCSNDKFMLSAIPGLTDALFEWPEWLVEHGVVQGVHNVNGLPKRLIDLETLFAASSDLELKRRHALEAVCIFRTATANNDANVQELSNNPRTRTLILFALHRVKPDSDSNTEFLTNILEIFQDISRTLLLPPPNAHVLANPVPPIMEILSQSFNRSLIIASLSLLATLFSNPTNVGHLSADSAAFAAAIRYLPLFGDKELVNACLNFIYAHLTHPSMARAFLNHPQMLNTLKLLVILLLSEQVEETVNVDLCPPPINAPATQWDTMDYNLSKEELETLSVLPEPQRCYEWMKAMFMLKADAEVTQVDFWTLYREVFAPYGDILQAPEVIKNINMIYPTAQAMVIPGPPQRFVVRGVSRRKVKSSNEMFKCRWNRSQCQAAVPESPGQLYEHILEEHLNTSQGPLVQCSWSTCDRSPIPLQHLRSHVLTHLPPSQPAVRHPSQSDVVTLPSEMYPHPVPDPTKRPVVPPRNVTVPFHRPIGEPPSSSLTALLCLRVLFRTSFASADAAPRVDEDHFGFPGIVDEPEDQQDTMEETQEYESEGERRGRKAFAVVRRLLEGVRIADDTLMGWIMEMVSVGMSA